MNAPMHLISYSSRGQAGKTYQCDITAVMNLASSVVNTNNINALLTQRSDIFDDVRHDLGRCVAGKSENERSASRVLLKVSVNEVDPSVDLDFESFFLLFDHVFGDTF